MKLRPRNAADHGAHARLRAGRLAAFFAGAGS
ncbi:MAG: hypothetical protein JWP52_1023, partial [Rhizobacter sp.]|nr:hypothetical protein [Rhizobacter sp.]